MFGESDHYKYFGSYYGIIIYIIGLLSAISYCVFIHTKIINWEKDLYSSVIAANDFSAKYNNISMDDINFMPFFEVRLLKELDPKFDIFETETEV